MPLTVDIADLLDRLGVPYVEDGPNVPRGEVGIKCPFCGDDPSEHLTINLESGFWCCWRNREHSGRKLHFLLRRLVPGLTREEADRLLGGAGAGLDAFERHVKERLSAPAPSAQETAPTIEFPDDFHPIVREGRWRKFFDHLTAPIPKGRGYTGPQAKALIRRYDLRACLTGEWAYRLIVPLYLHGRLVGWQGRALGPAKIRYRSHPPGEGTKRGVLGYDDLKQGGRVLAVCEGPFDAMRVDFFGRRAGLRATCLFGTSATADQIARLMELRDAYDELIVLLDAAALGDALRLAGELAPLGARVKKLPPGRKDPGELAPDECLIVAGGGQ